MRENSTTIIDTVVILILGELCSFIAISLMVRDSGVKPVICEYSKRRYGRGERSDLCEINN
jgi:hypothetical protein